MVPENGAELLENTIISNRGKAKQRGGLARTGDNPDTLISHWTFDDSSSADDKGSNEGTDTAVTYVTGKFGKAASFNGTTSSILVAASSDISVSTIGAFRISAWVYVDTDGEGDQGRIFDKFSGASTGYRLFVYGQSGSTVKLDFEVGHATTNTRVITSSTFTTGAWHKIDAIYNTDKSGDVYVDGAIATYSTDTTGVGAATADTGVAAYIGSDSTSAYTFNGEIDDVRIYDGSFTADDLELDSIKGITRFTVGSTIDTVLRVKDTSVQRLSSDYKDWTNVSGATSFTADTTTNFIQALDKMFILNGTDNVHSLDSALAVTDEGNTNVDPPKTTVGEWATNNRLFLSGSLTVGERDYVWYSDSLAPQTFDRATNLFKVRSGSGGKVTQLKMFKDFELIVYKNDSIFVLDINGTDPLTHWALKPLSVAIGCPAGRTVADIGNDHIFLANDGVRLLSRTSFDKLRVGVISEPIQDIIDDINQDAIQNSVGYFDNGLYILGVPTGTSTTPNRFVIWDSIAAVRNQDPNSAWTTIPEDTWNLSCITSFSFGDNLRTFVGGDGRSLSLCYKLLSGNTDNGTTIVQKIITRRIDFGEPFVDKIFDPTQIITDPGENCIYACAIANDGGTFNQFGTLTSAGLLQTPFTTPAVTIAGTDHEEENFRTKFIGRGHYCKLQFTNSVYNTNGTFNEYTVYGRPYGGRI
jgi:hypothetical protein